MIGTFCANCSLIGYICLFFDRIDLRAFGNLSREIIFEFQFTRNADKFSKLTFYLKMNYICQRGNLGGFFFKSE